MRLQIDIHRRGVALHVPRGPGQADPQPKSQSGRESSVEDVHEELRGSRRRNRLTFIALLVGGAAMGTLLPALAWIARSPLSERSDGPAIPASWAALSRMDSGFADSSVTALLGLIAVLTVASASSSPPDSTSASARELAEWQRWNAAMSQISLLASLLASIAATLQAWNGRSLAESAMLGTLAAVSAWLAANLQVKGDRLVEKAQAYGLDTERAAAADATARYWSLLPGGWRGWIIRAFAFVGSVALPLTIISVSIVVVVGPDLEALDVGLRPWGGIYSMASVFIILIDGILPTNGRALLILRRTVSVLLVGMILALLMCITRDNAFTWWLRGSHALWGVIILIIVWRPQYNPFRALITATSDVAAHQPWPSAAAVPHQGP